MAITSSIFKAYDIRGTVPDQLVPAYAHDILRAFVVHTGVKQVAVGHDMRVSSPAFAEAAIAGIIAQGAEAVDLGQVSSDQLYCAVGHYGLAAGVMITASHNPGVYNGLKFCLRDAVPVSSDTGLFAMRDMLLGNALPPPVPGGRRTQLDSTAVYVQKVLSFVHLPLLRPLKVAIDAGNGMAGKIVPEVFRHLPFEVIPLYFELDGTFPHHPASPIEPENMVDLQRLVRSSGADVGAAFDGDADRMFLVDEKGGLVGGDMVIALVAQSFLRKQPGSTILYNLISSHSVPELIEREHGRAVRTRVGHSYIKAQMRQEDAVFGGEHSGHYYYRDFWYADSGMISLLQSLEILSVSAQPLSQVIAGFDVRCRSGEINTRVSDIPARLQRIEQAHATGKIDHLDGLTVEYPGWWFNIRGSNTEPLLRLNIEADSCAAMEQHKAELLALIRG